MPHCSLSNEYEHHIKLRIANCFEEQWTSILLGSAQIILQGGRANDRSINLQVKFKFNFVVNTIKLFLLSGSIPTPLYSLEAIGSPTARQNSTQTIHLANQSFPSHGPSTNVHFHFQNGCWMTRKATPKVTLYLRCQNLNQLSKWIILIVFVLPFFKNWIKKKFVDSDVNQCIFILKAHLHNFLCENSCTSLIWRSSDECCNVRWETNTKTLMTNWSSVQERGRCLFLDNPRLTNTGRML